MAKTTEGTIVGRQSKDWEQVFRRAGVLLEELQSKGSQAKAVKIGNFLSQIVGRTVPIQVDERLGQATLCATTGRSRQKRYFFRVAWDDEAAVAPDEHPAPMATSAADNLPAGRGRDDSQLGGEVNSDSVPSSRPTSEQEPAYGEQAGKGGNAEDW